MRPLLLATCARPESSPVLADSQPVPSDTPPVPSDTPPVPSDTPPNRPPPPGFVDLRRTLPTACFTPGLATADCQPLDMGTAWDTLDPRSHTTAATGEPLKHRLHLRQAMRAAGFCDYAKEWWHFSFPLTGTRPRDIPYGPHEPPGAI